MQRSPVEWGERGAAWNGRADPRSQHRVPPPRANTDELAVVGARRARVLSVELDERLGLGDEQFASLAGPGHRVPLIGDPSGGQHEREVGGRAVGRLGVRSRCKPCPPGRRREPQRGVEPFGAASLRVLGATRRGWPLQRPLVRQPPMRQAADIADPPLGACRVFVVDLGGGAPGEAAAVAKRAADPREDLPVRERLARRVERAA